MSAYLAEVTGMQTNPIPRPAPGEIWEAEFKDQSDLLGLEIIDFSRTNNYWPNPGKAMETVFGFLRDGRANYSVYKVSDFLNAPERQDFPEWDHVGDHHTVVAKRFWNWFRWKFPAYKLTMADEPDFTAYKEEPAGGAHFIFGDIGQVSVSAFALAQKRMMAGSMWISVLGRGDTHVVISSNINCEECMGRL